ncbi:hypothetical protein [Streptomyces sp. H34-S4]|uniref:hypothetical protein n=1 Tax=Streptomyces sp. H34-S4 TaxID=2996463 RepID=UPI00226DB97F|nr:hypothetical protein [Streptomyces sp. H34-S4]MCY0939255.1 hypothetical protein [Streptomyces sp. H34-S4]
MTLTDGDARMASRDFFTPAQLAAFTDLTTSHERAAWGERELLDPARHLWARRLPGEPDEGALCTWSPAPLGFRYAVAAPGDARSGVMRWQAVTDLIEARLTPVRYGALCQAVDAEGCHARAYHRGPTPFRDSATWQASSYLPWSRRAALLALRSAAAKDAILPAVRPQPSLF